MPSTVRVAHLGWLVATLAALAGCSGGDSGAGGVPAGHGNVGVTQGGAQDFGLFRQILDQGGIPGPETLDDVGFFAEHKLDYPTPTCGANLCLHALFGAHPNLVVGTQASVVQVGLNSPIDLATFVRPPMHLVLAIDVSGSMGGAPIDYVRTGLTSMLGALEPGDRVSLVTYASEAQVVLDAVPASDTGILAEAIAGLAAGGSTNIYDGLFQAYTLAAVHLDPAWQNRVLLLSDGQANTGLDDTGKIVALAEGRAREGIALSSIGVGTDFDVELMSRLGEVGAGNFYFLEDPAAVVEVFEDEVKTFLYPLAVDARITMSVASGYELRAAYGTNGWASTPDGGEVELPALFLAGRTTASEPIEAGRRGGGGAILIELMPSGAAAAEPNDVGQVAIAWRDPATGDLVSDEVNVVAPHSPAEPPPGGYFTDATVAKGFAMLNLYAAFRIATERAAAGDPWTAESTLAALRPNVANWLVTHPDPDLEDDLHYVDLFIANLGAVIATSTLGVLPTPGPVDPWPYYE
ncbi:MAG: VWA domain-containing protein [Myxococcales bacterium]|nr:VWA domain-containing protein [Myxococcales bacterium]